MRILIALLFSVSLAACGGLPLVSGGDSGDTFTAADGSFSLKLPAGWSVQQKGGGEGGRIGMLVHKDATATGKGYPTVMLREVTDPTPQGLLDLMSKDKNLAFTELWTVSPDKYQLKQALLDNSSRVLSYWLTPRDGQGLEYYAITILTGYGRIEAVGMAEPGTVEKYLKDFNAMFTAISVAEQARFNPSKAPTDLASYLRQTYKRALDREKDGLNRLTSETAGWASSSQGISPQEKGFLNNTYVRAANRALEACAGLSEVVGRAGVKDARAEMQRFADRLEEAATSLETVQLNIRDPQARASVEKSSARVRRMAALGREAAKLPL